MQKLYDLVEKNENWLIKRILGYAKEHNYTRYTSTLEEAWRMSIVGLSSSILSALRNTQTIPELAVDHDYLSDPIASFGILEAKKHRKRGVNFRMFLGLMKYYRQSYLDLVGEAGFEKDYEEWCLLFIGRVFDRIEIGFSSEWLESAESKLVTELQNSNRLLTNEKNWYLTIYESLPTPVIFLNRDNRIENMNFAASQLFQFSKVSGAFYYGEESVARPLTWFDEELKAFAEHDEPELVFEKRIELRSDVRTFEVKLARILDVSEKFRGTVIILNDVSDRKKMEDLIFLSSQKEWEDTFNTITDMITIHDRDFNIVRANNAAKEFLKLPGLSDLVTKCYEYFHGSKCPPEKCVSCECLTKGETVTFEKFEPHLNMFLEIRAIPKFDGSNNVAGVIHVVRDITARKKLEEQLRESQKMEAVGHLAGGIAHDFNNMLSAIKGSAHLIRKRIDKDGSVMSLVEQILEASHRATGLVRGLLAYSRKQIIATRPVNVNEIIIRMEKLLLRLIGEDIEISLCLAEEDLTIMADSIQIEQVLMNLAANARDAMPEGGRLFICTEAVKLDRTVIGAYGLHKPGVYACISVSDTGIGIDGDSINNIFEPFYTTKEVGKGTGLGLSIVYGIIKQHEGHITVHSERDVGTIFRMYLPLKTYAAEERPSEHERPFAGGTETVLLAEDEGVVRKTSRDILEDAGYKVIEAIDGDDALSKFMEYKDRIQIVILDVIMPKKNGKEVCEKILEMRPDMKILFTSGYSDDIISKKGILEQGIHFASKPGYPEELLVKIREVLDGGGHFGKRATAFF
jgi:signal transduction histidine kinase/ActR/RegA family two-component response regulator